jgi:GNAT superfamily N-acetyltransferase
VELTKGFQLRDARPVDCPALTTIVRTSSAYAGPYRVMVAPLAIDVAYLAANPTRVCADDQDVAVGFASLLLPGRGDAGEAGLDYMFVDDRWQRRGIGRALLADVVAIGERLGVRRIHIVSHPPAEPFYLSVGAVHVGEVAPAGRITWTRPLLRLDMT